MGDSLFLFCLFNNQTSYFGKEEFILRLALLGFFNFMRPKGGSALSDGCIAKGRSSRTYSLKIGRGFLIFSFRKC